MNAEETLRAIAETLWPDNDADHEWDASTLDEVARLVTAAGFGPHAEEK